MRRESELCSCISLQVVFGSQLHLLNWVGQVCALNENAQTLGNTPLALLVTYLSAI